jgi:hypothetical protein
VAVAPGGAAGRAATVGKKRGSQLGEKKTGLLPAPYVGRVDLQQARTIPLHLSK